jgi:hypothetical protein
LEGSSEDIVIIVNLWSFRAGGIHNFGGLKDKMSERWRRKDAMEILVR